MTTRAVSAALVALAGAIAAFAAQPLKIELSKTQQVIKEFLNGTRIKEATKPNYVEQEGKLLFTMGRSIDLPKKSDSVVDQTYNRLIGQLYLIELHRRFPPPYVDKKKWDAGLDACVANLAKVIEAHNRGDLDGKTKPDPISASDMYFTDTLTSLVKDYAASRNLTFTPVRVYRQFRLKIETEPPGGKVYIMSDLQWRIDKRNGRDPQEEIKTYAVQSDVSGIEGTIWYWAVWPDGSTVGPENTDITADVLTIKK